MSNTFFDPVDAQITKRVLTEIMQQANINVNSNTSYYDVMIDCIKYIDIQTAGPVITKVVDIDTQNKINYDRAMSII